MSMNRETLIRLAIKYGGEYENIIKAIDSNDTADEYDVVDNAITIFDDEYPNELLNLRYPPLVLFYKGNIKLLNVDKKITVIGSRTPTEYSLKATKKLVENKQECVIVSGLAKGIDACAHENASKTIAVLGCGIDYIYPKCNYELFKRIEKDGLILSEYPKNTKPLGYHFPFRNRITVALGNEIYIAECKEHSGTTTAINEALDINKQIYVLPFDVFEAKEKGIYNNVLISEGSMMWNI